jgi:hypothetical protein
MNAVQYFCWISFSSGVAITLALLALCSGINALKTGRVDANRFMQSWSYRDKDPISFWCTTIFNLIAFFAFFILFIANILMYLMQCRIQGGFPTSYT